MTILKQLRWYTGCALLGAVFCGLVFAWSHYCEFIQWIGAGIGMLISMYFGPPQGSNESNFPRL